MADVRDRPSTTIVLTFDDGPHAEPDDRHNRTLKVGDTLKSKDIKAAFFVQAHLGHRLMGKRGREVVGKLSEAGVVVGYEGGGG